MLHSTHRRLLRRLCARSFARKSYFGRLQDAVERRESRVSSAEQQEEEEAVHSEPSPSESTRLDPLMMLSDAIDRTRADIQAKINDVHDGLEEERDDEQSSQQDWGHRAKEWIKRDVQAMEARFDNMFPFGSRWRNKR